MKKNTRKGFLFQTKSITYRDKNRKTIDYLQCPLYIDTMKRLLIFAAVKFAINLNSIL